jgi:hypothetical protein
MTTRLRRKGLGATPIYNATNVFDEVTAIGDQPKVCPCKLKIVLTKRGIISAYGRVPSDTFLFAGRIQADPSRIPGSGI